MGYYGDGGPATAAELKYPFGETVDKNGNIYICDYSNFRIRKVTPAGIISDFAGNGSWGLTATAMPALSATIDPTAIAMDTAGNFYVADSRFHCIYKINTSDSIRLIAGNGSWGYTGDGGPATAAQFNQPDAVAVDNAGNIYICDNGNSCIRKINTAGIISTIAGNTYSGFSGDGGAAIAAEFSDPTGIAVDRMGNLYIADNANNRIRKVNTSGIITTVAGNGTADFSGDGGAATSASLNSPLSVAVDSAGELYISDLYNARIRKVSSAGIISTFAGRGVAGYGGDCGPADSAYLNDAYGMAMDGNGILYLADEANARIRKVFNNFIPVFIGGDDYRFTMCENGAAIALDSTLEILDNDLYQEETWRVLEAPIGGVATIAYSTPSTGGDVLPIGLSYMPNTGFSGTDSFKVMVTDGFGADTATIIVQVIPIPALGTLSGADTICAGLSGAITTTVPGGAWQLTDTTVMSITAAGIVTGTSAGADTVMYTVTNSCGTATLTFSVNIDPLPNFGVIFGAAHVCPGVPDTLTDTIAGGHWYTARGGVDTMTNAGVFSSMIPGTDSIFYGNTNICGNYYSAYAITIDSLPNAAVLAGKDSLCIGLSDTVNASVTGGVWRSTNTHIATITSDGIVSGLARGGDSVIYAVTNSCGTVQSAKTLYVETLTMSCYPTAVQTALTEAESITMFPNPNYGVFNVFLHAAADEEGMATLVDMMGNTVMAFAIKANKEVAVHTDIPAGVYMVQVNGKNGRYTGKVVVMK
jgi:sugar lactone lactonase YvrE